MVIFTLSWDLIGGICGQISLGQAFFFGTGTYAFPILSTLLGISLPLSFLLTLVISSGLALMTGILGSKLKGAFFALFTLAMVEVAHELTMNIHFSGGRSSFMGGEGGIPFLSGAGVLERSSLLKEYYLCFILASALLLLLLAFSSSDRGLIVKSIAGDELYARACGIRTTRIKIAVYMASALIATVAGILYVVHTGRATPHDFSIELSFQAATLAAVGGRGKVVGPAAAALFITTLFSALEVSPLLKMSLYALVLPAILLNIPSRIFSRYREKA